MSDDHVPTALDHVGNVLASLFDCRDLRAYILVLFVADQGITADSDDCNFAHDFLLLTL
jgi:hypothetical protein